jgi:cell division transport system ATP-binding protein
MLFVLKATGWTDNAEMQNKIEEVLAKSRMRDFGKKNATSTFGGTTTCGHRRLCLTTRN